MKKVIVLVGNYGSGKTEIAVNMALQGSAAGQRTLVIDLDKVNDYFRMSDKVSLLGQSNVNVVTPTMAGKGVTPSSMSAAVASAFTDEWDLVIFDVGGDAAGALSLGRYHQDLMALEEGSLHVYDIVNVFRPMSETAERIMKLQGELESFARLDVTGFVNNSNLLTWASADDLRRGYDVVKELSDATGLPVAHTTGREEHLRAFLADGRDGKYIGEPIVLRPYVNRSWESFTTRGF